MKIGADYDRIYWAKGLQGIKNGFLWSKTCPNLVGQHHQKVWLGVKRKHAQQSSASSQPGESLHKTIVRHVKLPQLVGSRLGAELALHAPAG